MLKIETNNGTKLTSFDTDFLNLIGKKVNVWVWKNPFEYTDKRTGEVKTGYGWNCELDKTSPIAEQKTLISKPELEDTSKILDALANIRKEIKEGFNEVLNEILNQNNGNN
jgi:hypothetical protein